MTKFVADKEFWDIFPNAAKKKEIGERGRRKK